MNARSWLAALALPALLAACGVTPDGSLVVSFGSVSTEFKDRATGDSVACDTLNGVQTATRVRVTFSASGQLAGARIRLVGQQSGEDNGFARTFSASELQRSSDGGYSVLFSADTGQGQFLPTSVHAQGIIPVPLAPTVKLVDVSPSAQIGVGFRSSVQGIAQSGDTTREVSGLSTVKVYSDCTNVSDTGTAL